MSMLSRRRPRACLSLALALPLPIFACSAEEPSDAPLDADTPFDAAGQLGDGSAPDAGPPFTFDAGDGAPDAQGEAGADGGTNDAEAGDASADGGPLRNGFPAVADLASKGPFATNNPQGQAEGPDCSVHRPANLGEGGVRHPIIIWGMGTGGFNTYQPSFDLWASHGFVVAAALLGNGQGDGTEMLACLKHVCDTYAANVDCRAGASGHSQGGGGALMAGQDPRVVTTAPIQPYVAQGFGGFDRASFDKQVGPMLLLSGTADNIATPVDNQKPVFDATNVPVVWANLVGGDHVATGIDGAAGYREVVLAWFRLQLMNDLAFRPMFYGPDCALCTDATWIVQRKGVI